MQLAIEHGALGVDEPVEWVERIRAAMRMARD